MVWAVIVGMCVLVFVNRYLFLEPRLPLKLGRHVKDFLGFAVPGLLTAICAPIVLLPGHQLDVSPGNPYLLGALVAIGVMLRTRNVLVTLGVSMLAFYLLRALLG